MTSFKILWNQGQNCSATSRVIIHEDIYPKVIDRVKEEVKKIKIGVGFNPENKLGRFLKSILESFTKFRTFDF